MVHRRTHAWFDNLVERLTFERDARERGMTIRADVSGKPRRLQYHFAIDVPVHDDRRMVTVRFKSVMAPSRPVVHIDGPRCLRHRFLDGSLCMWYGPDPSEEKWLSEDGLLALVAHIEEHAYCEGECRAGNDWPKPEAPGEHRRPSDCPSCPRSS